MLAKELKINNLIVQLEYITEQIKFLIESPNENGDTSYRYIGYVMPEVINYFNKEGFEVKIVGSVKDGKLQGLPIYLFTINDRLKLTREEIIIAENIQKQKIDILKKDALVFNE